jgi:hypothetical protein
MTVLGILGLGPIFVPHFIYLNWHIYRNWYPINGGFFGRKVGLKMGKLPPLHKMSREEA